MHVGRDKRRWQLRASAVVLPGTSDILGDRIGRIWVTHPGNWKFARRSDSAALCGATERTGVELDRVQHPHDGTGLGDSKEHGKESILGPVEQASWEANVLGEA